jgi:molecular chaperone GrpE
MTEEREAGAEVADGVEEVMQDTAVEAEETAPQEAAVDDVAAEGKVNDSPADVDGKVADDEDAAELTPEEQLIKQLEEDLATAQADLAEAQAEALSQIDKQQRLAAEFQNSKKRQERQLSDAIRRASEGVVTRLLPVLDDFDLAFGNVPDNIGEEDQSWVDGFQQIQAKLIVMLEDQGLTAIPRDGEFDPNLHEAVTSEPSDEVETGHIIETLRIGYEFKGRVLRPAMVRVAS